MSSRSFALSLALFVLTFSLTGCQPKSDETAQIELASLPGAPLEASFMSDQQSFAYTLHYDGDLMQIVDGQFEGASVVGPSFTVNGGAQIVVKSATSTDVAEEEQAAGAAQQINGLWAYHTSKIDGVCAVDTSIVPVNVEALVFTVKICDGQDAQAAQAAFYSLIEGLEVKAF